MNPPLEDCDETARNQRAREIAEGVDPPPGYLPAAPIIQQLPLPASIIQQAIVSAAARAAAASSAAAAAAASTPSAMMVAAMSAAVNAASGVPTAEPATLFGTLDDAALHMVLPNLVPHSDDMPRLVIHSQVCMRKLLFHFR